MTERANRVLTALRNDGDLLYEIALALRIEKMAGPWMADPRDHTKRVRRDADLRSVAIVKRHGTRNLNAWEASTAKPEGVEERPSRNFMTQSEALDWCDAQLLSQGYQLARGET